MRIKRIIRIIILFTIDLVLIIPILIFCIISRSVNKKYDIGLGPEPMINNIYHKTALQKKGFQCETFVNSVYYITDQFDIRVDNMKPSFLRNYYLFFLCTLRYKSLYIYFNGGPLGFSLFLWKIEPLLYKLANIKTVVMPYGGDIQDLLRTSNLGFRSAMSKDYKGQRLNRSKINRKIDIWTKYADHIISGCDWVEYMYYWDTLMLAHFSIDTDLWKPTSLNYKNSNTLRILHAPNHTAIKGTQFFIKAIKELKEEGYNIELVIAQKVSNDEIRELMQSVDVVADQLIIGWYAMFALEAMSLEKPVLCYIREDFEALYIQEGLLEPEELPIIKTSTSNVKDIIRDLAENKQNLNIIGKNSRDFVLKHHSIDAVGSVFENINTKLGIKGCSDYGIER